MKNYVGTVSIHVNDQDRAKKFYTEAFGWKVLNDAPMGDDARWLSVGPSGDETEIVLVKGFGDWSPEKVGVRTNVIIECQNVFETVKTLKEKGAEITQEASSEPWGGWAMFKDSEGNEFGLHSDPKNT